MPPKPQQNLILKRIETPLGGVDLLHARFSGQRFKRHSHERYPLGVIEEGALAFYYRGENVVAPAGWVNLANPGEPHTGQAAMGLKGWAYRMFYFERSWLKAAIRELEGSKAGLPFFKSGVLDDPLLAARIKQVHTRLMKQNTGALEREGLLLELLTALVELHADHHPSSRDPAGCHTAVALARDYLEANPERDTSLSGLSGLCGLSPYHLATIFRRETGLAPHQYLNQVRVRKARGLIQKGANLADAALQAGFFDQSHMSRRFKEFTGLTPGRYRKFVQESFCPDH